MSAFRFRVGAFVLSASILVVTGCGGSAERGEPSGANGGATIVLVSDRDNPPPEDEGLLEDLIRLELYVANLDSGKPIRLTTNEVLELDPDCSPDGTRIVFWGGEEAPAVELMNVDGTGRRSLTSGFHPSWAPDGSQVVFARDGKGGRDLFIVPAAGGPERPLLVGPGNDYWPAWSPMGDWIAFLRALDPAGISHDLYLTNAMGTETRRILRDVDGGDLAWSPDGHELAFARTVGAHAGIWIIDIETRRLRKLTREGQLENPQGSPAWSPDGAKIAFEETGGIATVRPDGSEYEQLRFGGESGGWVTWTGPTWCG